MGPFLQVICNLLSVSLPTVIPAQLLARHVSTNALSSPIGIVHSELVIKQSKSKGLLLVQKRNFNRIKWECPCKKIPTTPGTLDKIHRFNWKLIFSFFFVRNIRPSTKWQWFRNLFDYKCCLILLKSTNSRWGSYFEVILFLGKPKSKTYCISIYFYN